MTTSDAIKAIREAAKGHTPGPWEYGVRADGTVWLSIGNPRTGPHWQGDLYAKPADAHLIASAPILLAALDEATRERDAAVFARDGVLEQVEAKEARIRKLEAERRESYQIDEGLRSEIDQLVTERDEARLARTPAVTVTPLTESLMHSLSRTALELVKVEGERDRLERKVQDMSNFDGGVFDSVDTRWAHAGRTIRRLRRRWQWEWRRAEKWLGATVLGAGVQFQLASERDELKRRVDKTYCAYCGWEVPLDGPEAAAKVGAHIASCEKHPIYRIVAERDAIAARVERLERALRSHGYHTPGMCIEVGHGMNHWAGDHCLFDEPALQEAADGR